jgi:CelD/BcsL family acetyltransferase involved in cellulose biosynthesis
VTVYTIDPLTDARWDALLLRHRRGSVFHAREWLSALKESYGYTPVVFTTSAPDGPLENGVLFCEVRSRITGQRLVSSPFSDHCEPLIGSPAEYIQILAHVCEHLASRRCQWVEVRPLSTVEAQELAALDLAPSQSYYLHQLSLDPSAEELFRGLHKNCVQRKVRRAEKEGLDYRRGRSAPLLHDFYQLLIQTRRRHCLPPQPLHWFRHLIAAFGERLTIRVASKDDRPVAALLTLSFNRTITYKYGCSADGLSRLGGTPFLFWKTIREAKESGMTQLDLGLSEVDNVGLITFKDRLGAQAIPITRFCSSRWRTRRALGGGIRRLAGRILRRMPAPVLRAAGQILYRHFG